MPHEYDLLVLEATEGGPANAGADGCEDGHGALATQKGAETEDEGEETLREKTKESRTRRGDPPNSCAR